MGVYRFRVQYTYPGGGGPGYSLFHFRTTVDGGTELDADLTAARDALSAFFGAIRSLWPSTMTVSGDTSWVNVVTQEEAGRTSAFSYPGTSTATNYLPIATALVLSHYTSSRTRSGRGRTFIGPLAGSVADSAGAPTLAARTTLVTEATARLLTPFTGAGDGAFVVWSPTQQLARDVTQFRTGPKFAVLRSRRD